MTGIDPWDDGGRLPSSTETPGAALLPDGLHHNTHTEAS